MKIRESWTALPAVIVMASACATSLPLDDVDLIRIDADAGIVGVGGVGNDGASGSNGGSGDPLGQAGSPPLGGAGGSDATAGAGGAVGQAGAQNTAGTGGAGGAGGAAGAAGAAGAGGSVGEAGAAGAGNAGAAGSTSVAEDCVTPAATDPIRVALFYTQRADANQISMVLALRNDGDQYPMEDLVMRYWFDPDGFTGFDATVDFAAAGAVTLTPDVAVTFGEARGMSFADINVARADAIGTGINTIQLRMFAPNFPALTQTNDFSFLAGANNEENPNITVYVDGEQVLGCEPPAP